MWGGQSNTAQGRTVFPQGSHNTHKGIFSRGVPLDLWSGCLRFAWEAVVSCVAEEHCAGAGPSLLWGGRKGEQFFFFLHVFKLVLCFSHFWMDTAVVHPKDGSRSRLSEGWDAVPSVSGCSRQGGGSFRRKNSSDELVSHDSNMDLVVQ